MLNYKKYYNKLYEKPYHAKWRNRYKGYDEHIKLASSLVDGDRILDIGCGEGVITHTLKGNSVCGFDISANAIKYAKNNHKNNKTKYVIGSALYLPYKDNAFGCVSAFEVVEHLVPQDMHRCIKEIQRVCRSNGRVVISTPNLSSIYYGMIRSFRIQSKEHVNEMDFLEIINVLSTYFTIKSMHSHISSTWMRNMWLTNRISDLQDIFLKIFPPMKSLFYSQVYTVMINTKKD